MWPCTLASMEQALPALGFQPAGTISAAGVAARQRPLDMPVPNRKIKWNASQRNELQGGSAKD
jgi:hypothetical protein